MLEYVKQKDFPLQLVLLQPKKKICQITNAAAEYCSKKKGGPKKSEQNVIFTADTNHLAVALSSKLYWGVRDCNAPNKRVTITTYRGSRCTTTVQMQCL